MLRPLVTIYITNYNYDKYLTQSIESVLNQSFQDFELLIIDDGSIDNSKQIIERFRSNSKITIIYQQNKGLNITNNVAIRSAKGKYIMRLDADDFLEEEALELMVKVLESDEALGLVFPDYYYVDESGARTGVEIRHNFESEVSLYDQPAHGACTMIRLDYIKKLGGYNESFTCQDGYELWIKFIMHYKVTNISKPLFSYRRHNANLTNNESKILDTRKKIKELYVSQNFKTPKTLAIIPARNTFIGDVNWPLYEIAGKTVLERKVETCLNAKKLTEVVISTADEEIINFTKEKYAENNDVKIIKRPKEFQNPNETLSKTIEQVLNVMENENMLYSAVMTVSLEYPLLKTEDIDEAINTLILFDADAVLSVRSDNSMYYQHTGKTLKPILKHEQFTKLEREALYKGVGGIALSTISNFKKNRSLISGKISHVIVDQQAAIFVGSSMELELVTTYMESKLSYPKHI